MALNKNIKENIIKKHQRKPEDTGSAEVQIALMSTRVTALQDHLKTHKKDLHSKRGLLQMVHKRRKLLNYLKNKNILIYQELAKKLKIAE